MWKTVELVDACDLITCGVAKRPDYVESGIPFLSAKNVKKQKVIWDDYKYITSETHRTLTKHNKPEIGDVLYTRVGSFGEAAIVDKDVEFSIFVSLTLIKPKPILLNKFLTYYLNSSVGKSLAKKGVSSSGVGNLNVAVVRKFPIPLPPLEEQQRIVDKLDAAFAEIDEVNKLNDSHLNNLEILAKSITNNILNNTSYGWNTKFLYQISNNFDSKRIPITKNKRKKGDIPYYGASGIVDYVENYIFDDDLLLVSEDGANLLMRTYPIAFSVSGKSWVNNHAHVLKFDNLNLQKWVETYLNYIDLSSYISGMAQPKLNQRKLNEIPIIIPSETKLKKVISIINEMHNKIKELREINRRKLNLLKILNNSILSKELQSKKAA